jgi:phosphoribosylformimino-5-aminoimidazole carboxamide ribotide isomerase
MQIIPAIDLIEGKCVRLTMGDYGRVEEFGDDPVSVALRWQDAGAGLIHLVDLEGAKEGKVVNRSSVESITAAVEVETELGGGIRDLGTVGLVLEEMGVSRAVLGTAALKNPGVVSEAASRYGKRIIVGIDARDGMVATEGWLETSTTPAADLARDFDQQEIGGFIYTDIARDGTLAGPNFRAIADFAGCVSSPVIASGGVASLEDIRKLKEIPAPNIMGVIVGKALYRRRFTLEQAIAAARPGESDG